MGTGPVHRTPGREGEFVLAQAGDLTFPCGQGITVAGQCRTLTGFAVAVCAIRGHRRLCYAVVANRVVGCSAFVKPVEDVFLDGLPAGQVLGDDAVQHLLVHVVIPDAVGIDHEQRAAVADAEARR